MPENKSLGEIAYEGSDLGDHIGTPYKTLLPFSKCNWEAAAQAVRRAVIDECIQAIRSQIEVFSSEEYAVGQPLSSLGERFGCGACIGALRSLKGETDR